MQNSTIGARKGIGSFPLLRYACAISLVLSMLRYSGITKESNIWSRFWASLFLEDLYLKIKCIVSKGIRMRYSFLHRMNEVSEKKVVAGIFIISGNILVSIFR